MTIKKRLALLAAIITLGMLLQGALIQYSNHVTSGLDEIRLNIEQANSGMLLLRRREKDFLARFELKYEEEFIKDHTTLIAKSRELAERMAEYDMDHASADRLVSVLNAYKDDFLKLVAVQKRIGLNEKDGLYGSLRSAVHNVEDELKALGDDKLTRMMLTLRRNEKDFMLRENITYQEKLTANLAIMREALNGSSYDEALKEKVNGQLDAYEHDFKALVAGYAEKGLSSKEGIRGQMRETVHQTETLLAQMVEAITTNTKKELSQIHLMVTSFSVAIIVLSLLYIAFLTRSIIRPIHDMMGVMERIRSENDLNLRVDTSSEDEMAAMGSDLNDLLSDFQHLIHTILGSTERVSAAAEELSSITDEANGRMQQQINDTEMVAAAIEEMSASVQEVANSTNETAQNTEQAEQSVSRGNQVVNDTVASINQLAGEVSHANDVISKLEQESLNIGSVLDVIRGIAEQTNLLALNAAIEAARAGEQGRGFAVVADEVRTLASRTQQSTQEIQAMIEQLQGGAREAVAAMESGRQSAEVGVSRAGEANVALNEITDAIRTIHEMTSHIADASQQQGQVAGEVAQSIGAIKYSVDETGHSVDHISQASTELAQLATQLHSLVSHYKV